jgi:lysophospholipase L1-like esterase
MDLSRIEPETFHEFEVHEEDAVSPVIRAKVDRARVIAMIAVGQRDPNQLTNYVFFSRHPELPRKPLVKGQEALMREWSAILRDVVEPALKDVFPKPAQASGGLAFGSGVRVLLFGDSHTHGPFGRELERLLKGTGAGVVRTAVIGSAVKNWLPRVSALLREHRPTVVIVALGANMRTYPSVSGTSAQIAELVRAIRKEIPTARIVWIGPPREAKDTDAALARFNGIVRQGLDHTVRFVDSARHTPRYEGADGVHYAERAANDWARGVFKDLSSAATTGAVTPVTAATGGKPTTGSKPSAALPRGIEAVVVQRIQQYAPLIDAIPKVNERTPSLIRGIIAAESGGRANVGKGTKGYKGLMQASRNESHLTAATSIREGAQHFLDMRRYVKAALKKLGIDLEAMPEAHRLATILASYNAGQATVARAVQIAESSDPAKWLSPAVYRQAVMRTGAYQIHASCRKKATEEARIACGVDAKVSATPTYLGRILKYRDYFERAG